jgi:hypothetical protein
MHLEDLKFWHWTIIGLLAGLLFGAVKLSQGPWFDKEGIETLDQPTFELEAAGAQTGFRRDRNLVQRYNGNLPMLRDLVVHAPVPGEPTHSYWVTGEIHRIYEDHQKPGDSSTPVVGWGQWITFKYRAPVPYRAIDGAPGRYATVVEFLAAAQKKAAHPIPYRTAWWEQSTPSVVLPTLSGLLIIGIAWPLTLGLMQGAGLARAPSVGSRLPKNRNLSGSAKVVKDHSADDQKLAALNAQMDKALAGFGANSATSDDSTVAITAAPAGPKPLSGPDAAPSATPAKTKEERELDYGRQYYPVVRASQKKE